jgi:hypothetical protein
VLRKRIIRMAVEELQRARQRCQRAARFSDLAAGELNAE